VRILLVFLKYMKYELQNICEMKYGYLDRMVNHIPQTDISK